MHIILTGTESTYKSLISKELAGYYGLGHATEYARDYLQDKVDHIDFENFPRMHFHEIVRGQFSREHIHNYHDPLAKSCIFDTDHLTLEVWNREVWGESNPLCRTVLPHNYYLLCAPNTPWVSDGMRVDKHQREDLHQSYIGLLEQLNATYKILDAPTYEDRVIQAKKFVESWGIKRLGSAPR